jgi:alkylhydroperoxidase family enzyme
MATMFDTPATDRFPFLKREQLTPEAQAVWDARCKDINTTGLGGHFNVMMHSPKLCDAVSKLEGYFRFHSSHSKHDREFVTLVVLRKAGARFGWARHEPRSIQDGVPAEVVELIRRQAPLAEIPEPYRLMTEFARTLAFATEELPRELFDRMVKAKGEQWVLDAIGLIGHYSLVATTINGFGVRASEEVDGKTF